MEISNKTQWDKVLDRTLSDIRRQKLSLPKEWNAFSENQIDFLSRFKSVKESFECINKTFDVRLLAQNGPVEFLEQCVMSCLSSDETENIESRFLPFFNRIYWWIKNGGIVLPGYGCFHNWVLLHLVEMEYVEALKGALDIIHGVSTKESEGKDIDIESKDVFHGEHIDYNNSALIRACAKNNYEISRLFVSYGYR